MKQGQKRVGNDDFEQVEECITCKTLFWAVSKWELGNWENECRECSVKREAKEQKRVDKIKKEGKEVRRNGQVFGWSLYGEVIYNDDWTPPEHKNSTINASNIDDVIRENKKKGVKNITWHPFLFDSLLYFIRMNGYSTGLESPITYMGVKHFEGENGDYEYNVL